MPSPELQHDRDLVQILYLDLGDLPRERAAFVRTCAAIVKAGGILNETQRLQLRYLISSA